MNRILKAELIHSLPQSTPLYLKDVSISIFICISISVPIPIYVSSYAVATFDPVSKSMKMFSVPGVFEMRKKALDFDGSDDEDEVLFAPSPSSVNHHLINFSLPLWMVRNRLLSLIVNGVEL